MGVYIVPGYHLSRANKEGTNSGRLEGDSGDLLYRYSLNPFISIKEPTSSAVPTVSEPPCSFLLRINLLSTATRRAVTGSLGNEAHLEISCFPLTA